MRTYPKPELPEQVPTKTIPAIGTLIGHAGGNAVSHANAPHDERRIAAADERRATALADIQKMADDFRAATEENAQLKADLHREQDRCNMLIEERDKYRDEALLFRGKLIELATSVSNIGLLTVTAQEIMNAAHSLISRERVPVLTEVPSVEDTSKG